MLLHHPLITVISLNRPRRGYELLFNNKLKGGFKKRAPINADHRHEHRRYSILGLHLLQSMQVHPSPSLPQIVNRFAVRRVVAPILFSRQSKVFVIFHKRITSSTIPLLAAHQKVGITRHLRRMLNLNARFFAG